MSEAKNHHYICSHSIGIFFGNSRRTVLVVFIERSDLLDGVEGDVVCLFCHTLRYRAFLWLKEFCGFVAE